MTDTLKEIVKFFTPIVGEIGDIKRIRREMSTDYPYYSDEFTPADEFLGNFLIRYAALGTLALAGSGLYQMVNYMVDKLK